MPRKRGKSRGLKGQRKDAVQRAKAERRQAFEDLLAVFEPQLSREVVELVYDQCGHNTERAWQSLEAMTKTASPAGTSHDSAIPGPLKSQRDTKHNSDAFVQERMANERKGADGEGKITPAATGTSTTISSYPHESHPNTSAKRAEGAATSDKKAPTPAELSEGNEDEIREAKSRGKEVEELAMLGEMFEDIEDEIILQVYRNCRGQITTSVTVLLTLLNDAEDEEMGGDSSSNATTTTTTTAEDGGDQSTSTSEPQPTGFEANPGGAETREKGGLRSKLTLSERARPLSQTPSQSPARSPLSSPPARGSGGSCAEDESLALALQLQEQEGLAVRLNSTVKETIAITTKGNDHTKKKKSRKLKQKKRVAAAKKGLSAPVSGGVWGQRARERKRLEAGILGARVAGAGAKGMSLQEALDRKEAKRIRDAELRSSGRWSRQKRSSSRGKRKGRTLSPHSLDRELRAKPLSDQYSMWKSRKGRDWLHTPHLSSFLKLDALKKLFPRVDNGEIEVFFKNAGHDFYVALLGLHTRYPNQEAKRKIQALEGSGQRAPLIQLPSSGKDVKGKSDNSSDSGLGAELRRFLLKHLDASPTADSRNQKRQKVYDQYREEVSYLRRQRDKVLRNAAGSSMGGHSALAGAMAVATEEVREIRKQIRQAETEAIKGIFLFTNDGLDNHRKVDLHGLHVAEGRKVLRILLGFAQKAGRKEYRVITGVGNNSRGCARLGPAMEQYVMALGYACAWESPGQLRITLKPAINM